MLHRITPDRLSHVQYTMYQRLPTSTAAAIAREKQTSVCVCFCMHEINKVSTVYGRRCRFASATAAFSGIYIVFYWLDNIFWISFHVVAAFSGASSAAKHTITRTLHVIQRKNSPPRTHLKE